MGRLDNRCERPRAPFMCLVTQAPTHEEENSGSTAESGGGNRTRIASHDV